RPVLHPAEALLLHRAHEVAVPDQRRRDVPVVGVDPQDHHRVAPGARPPSSSIAPRTRSSIGALGTARAGRPRASPIAPARSTGSYAGTTHPSTASSRTSWTWWSLTCSPYFLRRGITTGIFPSRTTDS